MTCGPSPLTYPREVRLDVGDPGRSIPQASSTPTSLSRSHRTHRSPGLATIDHATTVRRSCSCIGSVAADRFRGAAFGVVMQELAVGLIAERGIPCGAEDEAVPCLVDRM